MKISSDLDRITYRMELDYSRLRNGQDSIENQKCPNDNWTKSRGTHHQLFQLGFSHSASAGAVAYDAAVYVVSSSSPHYSLNFHGQHRNKTCSQ